jgi:hypothetical protein
MSWEWGVGSGEWGETREGNLPSLRFFVVTQGRIRKRDSSSRTLWKEISWELGEAREEEGDLLTAQAVNIQDQFVQSTRAALIVIQAETGLPQQFRFTGFFSQGH